MENKTIREKEITIYGRVEDFSQLKTADIREKHEQWHIRVQRTNENASSGTVRVRKIEVPDVGIRYEYTVKTPSVNDSEEIETTTEANEQMFIQFRFMSESGMIKHRYTFEIPGSELKWELDAYPDGKGGYHPWVRMELEVPDLDQQLPEFPIQFGEVILPEGFGNMENETREAAIDALFKEFFCTPNMYLGQQKEEELNVSEENYSMTVVIDSLKKHQAMEMYQFLTLLEYHGKTGKHSEINCAINASGEFKPQIRFVNNPAMNDAKSRASLEHYGTVTGIDLD